MQPTPYEGHKAIEEQATFVQGWHSAVYDHIRPLLCSSSWPASYLSLIASVGVNIAAIMDDQYTRQQWAMDMRHDLRTPPLPHDIRPERDANRPEWDGTEYTPIQLQSDTNALQYDNMGYVNHVTTHSDSDTLNASDQDIYHASSTTTSIIKPKKPQSVWNKLTTTWWMEILTIFISTGFMIGLIAILASFQNRLQTEWTFFISINAVVAIVITAARATLLATVSVCLSQEKWNHFNNRARRLRDLNIIDRASRGPLGSIQMLFSVSWGVATVSAVVMILSLVTDSFVQQVVSFEPGTIYAHQNGSAIFRHAVSYSGGQNFDRGSSVHDGILFLNEDTGQYCPDTYLICCLRL